jgi:hypothetical protein
MTKNCIGILNLIDQKLQFTYPLASIKDVQAAGEAFCPQKKTPSTSKNEIYLLFSMLEGHFCPPGSGSGSRLRIRIQITIPDTDPDPDTDPGAPLNPDPIRIRIHYIGFNPRQPYQTGGVVRVEHCMGGMGYRSKDPTGSGSNPDPDPQRWVFNPWQSLPDGRGGEGGALHGRDGIRIQGPHWIRIQSGSGSTALGITHGSLPDRRGGEGGALHGRDGRPPEVALDERASQLIALVPVLSVSRHHVPAQFSQFLILRKLKSKATEDPDFCTA